MAMSSLREVKRVKLGTQGFEVSKLGLGCMSMSAFYGPTKTEEEMIAVIHHAFDIGVTFFDTAERYGPNINEILVGKAIKGLPRDKVQIGTKFGIYGSPTNLFENTIKGDPETVQKACEGSLERLGVDYIDIYYQHRVDTTIPIEITVAAMAKLVKEGKVKYLGLSEACSDDIRRAHAVHPITAVQMEYSLWSRDIEKDVIATCRELGIGIVPFSPLGRGFFSGVKATELSDGDVRKHLPRFQVENFERNQAFFNKLVALGKKKGATPGQLALAWVLHQGNDIAPIPGTTKVKNLDENVGSLGVHLTKEELKELEEAVPHEEIAGTRYADMKITWQYTSSPPLVAWDQGKQALKWDWKAPA